MAFLRWDDKYLLGHEKIDAEHRYLFELINDFYAAFSEDHDRARVSSLLNRLIDYAQRHFTEEEAVMRESGYPNLDAHHAYHEKLVEQVFELNEKFSNRAINPSHDTLRFLKTWLSDHILSEDMVLGAHLNNLQKK